MIISNLQEKNICKSWTICIFSINTTMMCSPCTVIKVESREHGGIKSTNPIYRNKESFSNLHSFHWYIKVGHFLGVIPYTLEYHLKSGKYELKRVSKFRSVVYYFLWSLSVLDRITVLRHYWNVNIVHRTVHYFYLAHATFCTNVRVMFCRTLFRKFTEIADLLDIIETCSLLEATSRRHRGKNILVFAANSVFLLLSFITPTIGVSMFPSFEWTPTWFMTSLVAEAKHTFFLVPANTSIADIRPGASDISWFHVFLAAARYLITLTSETQGFFIIMAFGLSSTTIWIAAMNFKKKVLEGYYRYTWEIEEAYQELSKLADSTNGVWHEVFFALTIDAILWLATDLDTAFVSPDIYLKIHVMYWLIYMAVMCILSAESYRMVVCALLVKFISLKFLTNVEIYCNHYKCFI